MKKLLLGLLVFGSVSAFASKTLYTNAAGSYCYLVEQTYTQFKAYALGRWACDRLDYISESDIQADGILYFNKNGSLDFDQSVYGNGKPCRNITAIFNDDYMEITIKCEGEKEVFTRMYKKGLSCK